MTTLSLQDQFTLQKGPLNDQELVLKDLLLRDSLFSNAAVSVINPGLLSTIGVAQTPTTPPVSNPSSSSGGDVVATQLA
ncbi:MAG: hypothetical protein RQ966_06305, partial [Acetobacteraceae bacterium]|nr:hypothetical protein [Acetobacteraceae bacterium]